jgi:opacity protein-like surface antigen
MRTTTLVTLTVTGFIVAVSSHVKAQAVANALQIGLGTDFVSYSNYTQRVTAPPGPPPPAVGMVDYKYDRHQTRWGVSDHSNLNVDIGYGLNDNFVLGGLLVLGGWTGSTHSEQTANTNSGVQQSTFSLFVGPKLDYMFLPGSRVRPFLGAVAGLSRVTYNQKSTNNVNVTTTDEDSSYTGAGFYGRAGVRFFLTSGFSLDPAFVFGFATMTGSAQGVVGGPGALGAATYDSGLTGFSLGLGVTASGWVGL